MKKQRSIGLWWIQVPKKNRESCCLLKSEIWNDYGQHFWVSGFGTLQVQVPKQPHIQTYEMWKRKGWSHTLGFRGVELCNFWCPNIDIHKFPKREKEKVRPAFRDFGVQNFASFGTQPQHEQTYEMRFRTNISQNCEKQWGTNISGFRDSGFRVFKYQTTIHYKSWILKGERMWDHHFRISGFRVSGFQKSTSNIQQLSKIWKVISTLGI